MTVNKKLLIFLSTHLIIWTLIPSVTNSNLPLDTIEALAWGSNLDWGFVKHPPLSALFPEIFYQIFGPQDWAYYFLSQLFVIIAFYYVYLFSLEILNNNNHAFLSLILLEGIFFYNFTTPEFNVNVCQLPFWAMAVYYGHQCFNKNKAKDYFILGLVMALGFLSKYLFIYLILGVIIFYFYFIKKNNFKIIYFLPGIIFLIIIFPHILWLTENNYITILYGLKRTGETKVFLDHIIQPLTFLSKQIAILVPFFLISFFLIQKKSEINCNYKNDNLIYLLVVNFAPLLLIFLTSLLMGAKIRTMWMTPFYLYFGTLFIYFFQNKINLNNLKNFYIIFIFFFLFSPLLYGYISITQKDKRTDYDGNNIAKVVAQEWFKNNRNYEIKYISGKNEWIVGNLSYHLKSRPSWTTQLLDNKQMCFDKNFKVTSNDKEFCISDNLITNKK